MPDYFDWNETNIARLRQLWREGHSTAEIGRRLGTTKNSVISKARSEGLPARPSPIKRSVTPERRVHRARALPAGASTLPPLASLLVPVTEASPVPYDRPHVSNLRVVAPVPPRATTPLLKRPAPPPRPPVIPPSDPVLAEADQIRHWAAQRGITTFDLHIVNDRRYSLGLAPFQIKPWSPARNHAR